MKFVLFLLLIVNVAIAATTTHRSDKLKLGRTTGEDIYIFADTGVTNLPYIFYDFSESVWKQSNDGTTSEVIGGASVITTEGDLILGNASGENSRLGIGTNGQLLQSNGTTATWATVSGTDVTTKGDLQTHNGTSGARLPVGNDGEFLVADSGEVTGLKFSDQLQGKLNPVTDSEPYTPTIANGGTTSSNLATQKRVGDSLKIIATTSYTGTGSAATLTYALPSGLSIDTTNIDTTAQKTVFGSAQWFDSSAGIYTSGTVVYESSTNLSFQRTGGGGSLFGSALASGDFISFEASVPIVGWSSGLDAVVQNKKVINAKMSNTVAVTIPNSTETQLTFNTKDYDPSDIINIGSNTMTIVEDGYYKITPNIQLTNTVSSSLGANTRGFVTVKINGTNEQDFGSHRIGATAANVFWNHAVSPFSKDLYLQAGDVLTFFVEHNWGSNVDVAAFSNSISISQNPENFVVAGTFGKCQTKFLSGSITAAGTMTDLTFNNLTIGNRYRLRGQLDSANGALINSSQVNMRSYNTYTGEMIFSFDSGDFTATATQLTLGKNASGTVYGGTTDRSETWAELCTSNMSATTEFN